MLKEITIETKMAERVSPIVSPFLKEGSVSFSVEYRNLNTASKINWSPKFCIDKGINSFGEAVIFYLHKTNSGYWKTEFDETSCK